MCVLFDMSKQLVYAFSDLYNKETISSNKCKCGSDVSQEYDFFLLQFFMLQLLFFFLM